MNIKNAEVRSKNAEACRRGAVEVLPSAFCLQPSRRGIALVITLILLSVTLIMAVAFLHIANRERNAVNTTTDTTVARLATDTALAAAQAQIAATILATNAGAYNYHLLVSTNYINYRGYDPVGGLNGNGSDPTNVNYDYTLAGNPLAPDQRNQNIANLWLSPRAPVLTTVDTNDPAGRFYLDLNHNGQFDGNGAQPQIDSAGLYIHTDGTGDSASLVNVATNNMIGDPEWVGVLEHPDQPHGPNNLFVARYAFVAQPIGNTLDLNYIHNQTQTEKVNPSSSSFVSDGYFRNEGVGSWELNLAAFLADLNTNQWNPPTVEYPAVNNPYLYQQPAFANKGAAFEDALSLLSWRYAYSYNSLAVPPLYFYNALVHGSVDGYTVGNLMTNTYMPPLNAPLNGINAPWAGSDNTNRFFALPSELYDATKSSSFFVNRLMNAGTYTVNGLHPTYDQYTFYRMLDQIGTGTTADDNRMNLNYSNAVVIYNANNSVQSVTIVPGAETNDVLWRPLDFFTTAADQMLRAYTAKWFAANPANFMATYYGITYTNFVDPATGYGLTNSFLGTNTVPAFGVGNIPVYVNGQFVYSPAVNRLLQLAANMYDASTNVAGFSGNNGMNYPSVFRPVFEKDNNTNIFIKGYAMLSSGTYGVPNGVLNTVGGPNDQQLELPYTVDQLRLGIFPANNILLDPNYSLLVNVYGVPWIIGAKKGFPNFNKFGMQDVVQITRKLQMARKAFPPPELTSSDLVFTNQLYGFNIKNTIGIDCWNSYASQYPSTVQIIVNDTLSMWITNSYGLPPSYFNYYLLSTNLTVTSWPGYSSTSPNSSSFIVPINRTVSLLTNADFYFGTTPPGVKGFYPDYLSYGWETNRTTFDLPQFGLLTTNSLQLAMLDVTNGVYHVIDYVQFAGPQTTRNLNSVFQTSSSNPSYDNMWSTNLDSSGLPWGIVNQLSASEGGIKLDSSYWKAPRVVPNASPADEIYGFRNFLGLSLSGYALGNTPGSVAALQYYTTNLVVQVPYTPTAIISDYTSWQANDPLVHYLTSDLTFTGTENGGNVQTGNVKLPDNATNVPGPSYTQVNDRYQPWGAIVPSAYQTSLSYDFGSFNLSYKDPLVSSSDYWDFPTSKYPTVGWLGRVHRGTPWQTVYLKASDILNDPKTDPFGNKVGPITWATWTGDIQSINNQYFDAANSAPMRDRELFDLFSTSLNDNATRGTLSVNVGAGNPGPTAGLAAWSALFSGLVALTNTVPDYILNVYKNPTNNWTIISPAGVNGTYSQLGYLVTNINNTRSTFVNADGVAGVFERRGDILSVAALTEKSPFLNWTNSNPVQKKYATTQQQYGISDEVYEWLPQQALGLLRASVTPRYAVYVDGQTLRPAANAFVTASGPFFGLCTNYQVTAESSARVVIRVDQHTTTTGTKNYSSVIESYNPLPAN